MVTMLHQGCSIFLIGAAPVAAQVLAAAGRGGRLRDAATLRLGPASLAAMYNKQSCIQEEKEHTLFLTLGRSATVRG
jgi:hypothetical protein